MLTRLFSFLPHSAFFPALLAATGFQLAWLTLRWGTPAQAVWYADLSYLLVIYLSVGVSFTALRAAPKQRRSAAGLLTAALTALGAGESIWVYLELFTTRSPDTSVADLCYYAFYALLGLTLLRRSGTVLRSFQGLGLLLDSLIITLVIGLYVWAAFLASVALDQTTALLTRVVTVSYPALDLGLLALILLTVQNRRPAAPSLLLAGGLSVYIVADLGYAFLNGSGAYLPGNWIDLCWSLGTVSLALASWRDSNARPGLQPARTQAPHWLQRGLTFLPAVAVLASCGLLLHSTRQASLAAEEVVWGTVAVFGLVMARQAVSFQDNARLTRELRSSSSQLERSKTLLTHQAFHDVLTDLPNRALFRDRLEQALAETSRHSQHLAVLFLDLDGFKLVNDRLGHAAGDSLLLQASRRMQGQLREGDTLARMGGDEFTVILTQIAEPHNAAEVAARLIVALSQPFEIAGSRVQVTASGGLSVFTRAGEDADQLQRQADLALYHAKASGKNIVHVFTPDLASTVHARERLQRELPLAVERGELELHYQPQFCGPELVGVEALLRWQSPVLGQVPPDEFIPVAEDTGLITSIGAWVLERACAQASRWREQGTAIRVAVNISPRQFAQPEFVAQIAACLNRHALPSELLELELTERLVIQDLKSAADKIEQLRQLGVRVSLDDFGAGQSSLSYLMTLPVSALKIDRNFVANAEHSESGQQVIQAITAIARAMQLPVVAEGVETDTQLALMRALGCDIVQGYLLGRPVPAEHLSRWLTERLVSAS